MMRSSFVFQNVTYEVYYHIMNISQLSKKVDSPIRLRSLSSSRVYYYIIMVFNIHPIRLYGIHLPPTLSIWLNRRDPRAVLDGEVHDTIGQTASIVDYLYGFRPVRS